MEEHKRHHFVPVCYLKQFTYEKNSITHVYDKIIDNHFPQNIKEICCKDHFYRLSNEYLESQNDELLNPLSIELDFFAKPIEEDYDIFLKWIYEESIKRYKSDNHYLDLTFEEKFTIARFITIQYLRTPIIRDFVVSENKRLEDKMLRLFKQGLVIEKNNPHISDLSIKNTIDNVSTHAIETYLDNNYINSIANHLAKSYWHFYFCPDELFYSSDNPVTIFHRNKDCFTGKDYGLTDYGAEISIPINPNLLLTIYDYHYYTIYDGTDRLFVEAVKEHIDYANVCQIICSNRIVYNKSDDFTAVKQFKQLTQNS